MGIAERKEKEKMQMRRRILDAARKFFVEDGFDRVTIRRIAEEIEYSPATIYLYFKDKNDILSALCAQGFEKLFKEQKALLAIKDPWERLRRHAEIYISFAMKNPEYYDLMFIMRVPARELKTKNGWELGMRSFESLKENVRACMEAGYLPKAGLDTAAFALWSCTHGIASLFIRDRLATFRKEIQRSMTAGALDFLMSGIKRKRQGKKFEAFN